MIAYCYRTGVVEVTDEVKAPEGSLELFRGPHRKVLRLIADTTENKQIPGMDKSTGLTEDYRILTDYLERLKEADSPLITVSELTLEAIAAEVATDEA